jgi:hypothetical protein
VELVAAALVEAVVLLALPQPVSNASAATPIPSISEFFTWDLLIAGIGTSLLVDA